MRRSLRIALLCWTACSLLAATGAAQVGASAPSTPAESDPTSTEATKHGPATPPEVTPALDPSWLSEHDAEVPLAALYQPRDGDSTAGATDAEGYYQNLYRRFSLSLGAAAYTKFNTNFQLSSDAAVGADIDMEDLLGLDDSGTVARLDGRYAFNRRHWLEFSYYDINRDGERSIPDDIQVGDEVIPAGPVKSKFDTAIAKLAYRYNFVTDTRTVIGASAGIHLMQLETAIRSESFAVEETFEVDAPLPVLGLHGSYALSEKWRLSASAEFLQFDIGDYSGLITDTRLTLDHDTFEHFGWGIGFNGFSADAELEGDDLNADLEYGYQGLMLYARLLF